jgi:hypothetical protein
MGQRLCWLLVINEPSGQRRTSRAALGVVMHSVPRINASTNPQRRFRIGKDFFQVFIVPYFLQSTAGGLWWKPPPLGAESLADVAGEKPTGQGR